ncbi:unnamed protein product [Clavelina lepadiformis]|uniref:G-protein coupled receptors family 1 profile domain-containing protein n=1 Tax=Clavelina lepadiformis TaxID=159417 RepID=A0ABP0FYM9_CLALP
MESEVFNYQVRNQTTNETTPVHSYGIWIADISIIVTLSTISLYVVIALIFHYLRLRFSQNVVADGKASYERNFTNVTKALCIVIAVISVIHNVLRMWMLIIEKQVIYDHKKYYSVSTLEEICRNVPRTQIFVLLIGTGLVYVFLWARQRVFYINPSLRILNSTPLKILSYLTIGVWLVYFVSSTVIYCAIVHYHSAPLGSCQVHPQSIFVFRDIIISWVLVSVVMQVFLLGLFVYPIIKRTSIVAHLKAKKGGFESKSSQKRLHARMKRAMILTCICLISDVISAAITVVLYRRSTNNSIIPYHLNLVVNLFATVGCFDNWREMLWPWNASSQSPSHQYARRGSQLRTSSTGAQVQVHLEVIQSSEIRGNNC